jgi:hypothetical protein
MGEARGTQMAGASSTEAKVCTKPQSPGKTVTAPNTDDDTIEILVVRDGARIVEVVERRGEGMQRCRI